MAVVAFVRNIIRGNRFGVGVGVGVGVRLDWRRRRRGI